MAKLKNICCPPDRFLQTYSSKIYFKTIFSRCAFKGKRSCLSLTLSCRENRFLVKVRFCAKMLRGQVAVPSSAENLQQARADFNNPTSRFSEGLSAFFFIQICWILPQRVTDLLPSVNAITFLQRPQLIPRNSSLPSCWTSLATWEMHSHFSQVRNLHHLISLSSMKYTEQTLQNKPRWKGPCKITFCGIREPKQDLAILGSTHASWSRSITSKQRRRKSEHNYQVFILLLFFQFLKEFQK